MKYNSLLPLALGLVACGGEVASGPTVVLCDDSAPATWTDDPELDVDYTLDCELIVRETLVIEMGTVVELGPSGGILVDRGRLITKGVTGNPVVLRAANVGLPWHGLAFFGDGENRLDATEIIGAGAKTIHGQQSILVGRDSFGEGHVSIRDCVIDGVAGIGIDLGPGTLDAFERNVIRGHDLAARTVASGVGSFQTGNTYDNVVDVVEVIGELQPTAASATWRALELPYRPVGDITLAADHTIEPGVELRMGLGASFNVQGALTMAGTASSPISIAAEGPAWNRIFVAAPGSRMEHVRVSGGGSAANLFGQDGMVVLDANTGSTLEIRDCVLEGSESWGIWDGSGGLNQDAETANTFASNAMGDVRRP